MKAFLYGAAGALLVLVAAAVIVPQYADYRSRAETSAWLARLRADTLPAIEAAIRRSGRTAGAGDGIAPPDFGSDAPGRVEITTDGIVLLQGGRDGQLLVLMPQLLGDEVTWICRGGSAKAAPAECR